MTRVPSLPLVSVVVLNWNGAGRLRTCLESVAALTYPARETIVVDNGSTDGSADGLERDFPGIRVLRNGRNLGYSGGNNVGILAGRGEMALLVNDDAIASAGILEPMAEAMRADPRVASCSPKILRADDPRVINSAGLELHADGWSGRRGAGEADDGRFDEPAEVFGAHGACVLFRRAALDEVGLLDEDFFAYNEEFDLAWRLQLAGWTCRYVPQATVRHVEAASSRGEPDRIMFLMERNRIWTLVKNAGLRFLARSAARLVAAEVDMLRHCAGVGTLTPLAARVASLPGLPRMLVKRRAVQRLRRVGDERILEWAR
jgi:GT2 family glycosyltransferase